MLQTSTRLRQKPLKYFDRNINCKHCNIYLFRKTHTRLINFSSTQTEILCLIEIISHKRAIICWWIILCFLGLFFWVFLWGGGVGGFVWFLVWFFVCFWCFFFVWGCFFFFESCEIPPEITWKNDSVRILQLEQHVLK